MSRVLWPLSYRSVGASGRTRTASIPGKGRMLDLLSFRGMMAGDTGFEPAHTGLKGRPLSQYALSPEWCPSSDSNRPCAGFKAAASASWATRAFGAKGEFRNLDRVGVGHLLCL